MSAKRGWAKGLGKYVLNPPVRALFGLGIPVPGTAILETVGRRSGVARRTPVTDGTADGTFWIVAEHGRRASYVQNIEANPRVRVKVRRHWRPGTAHVDATEDPLARLAAMRQRRSARFNAGVVAAMSTELLVLRVELD
jgi:deazaflavin-dependent oxidoreductase (nitroreductase family)